MSSEQKPFVNKSYLLQKFEGKGGWTYAQIPEIKPNKSNPFGWVRVRGWIDDYEIKNYHLMPMGNGQLFLPVKAVIRKKIKKQAGDKVWVKLYPDDTPTEIPEEFLLCLQDEPKALQKFMKCTDGEKKAVIDWICEAKTVDTKIERMSKAINEILVKTPK